MHGLQMCGAQQVRLFLLSVIMFVLDLSRAKKAHMRYDCQSKKIKALFVYSILIKRPVAWMLRAFYRYRLVKT